ncbi:sperm-associated antigen 4 protein-like isoform X2 [Nelusetta ayraudi]|uniref:sperm-associated antigen 4 protein-like isoform X2 n=1 Tax=Nelusetta ayraudi TaxID=303726 RepID=UPI003F6F1E3C
MNRRSSRLAASSYYNKTGSPSVFYGETKPKLPKKSKKRAAPRKNNGSQVNQHKHAAHEGKDPPNNNRKFLFFLCFTLGLCCEFTYLISAVRGEILDLLPLPSPLAQESAAASALASSSFPADIQAELNSGYDEMLKCLKELQAELQVLKRKYLPPEVDAWPNFALDSQGASVVLSHTSESYHLKTGKMMFGISLYHSTNPKIVIQAHSPLVPGDCWAFAGQHGQLVIALSHQVKLSHVTLGHISKSVSPTGTITSAPKEFSVFGMTTLDNEGTKLGTFLYDQDGDSVQTFKLQNHQQRVFRFVKLHVRSNWGHPHFSCVYSLRVHGLLAG